jgi:GntR family transcriptional regulator/MocR family aminotransferase
MPGDWATFGVDLHLETETGTGRRSGLERALRDAIRSGRLAPHARLPSTRALAADLGLSRGTVSAAFDQLVAEGFLTVRRGSGTIVSELPQRPSPAGQERTVGQERTASQERPASQEMPAGQGQRDAAERVPRHDLRPGRPDVSMFPVAAWLRATRRALGSARSEAYGYGDPRGRVELRTALAEYLGRARGVLADPGQIVITSGYVQALALLGRVLGAAGTAAIAMEDPGLEFHREIVRRAGLSVLPLPVDERGARTETLTAIPGRRAGAVVVTPAHQYPTGGTLHPDRRRALAEWARTAGRLVIEDDYDGEFRYDRQPVGALQGMAPGRVAYVGTASKTLGPALRLGWMVLPDHLVGPVAEEKRHHDNLTEVPGQLTLAEFITSHAYDRHIRSCRLRYRRRRDLLIARLAPGLGRSLPGLRIGGIAAGLQALLSLPAEGPGERELLARAAQHGLALDGLASHWHQPGDHPQGIVVGFGTPTQRAYPVALDALARVLHAAAGRDAGATRG